MTTGIPSTTEKQDASVTITGGLVTCVDPSFSELTGYPGEMLIGRPLEDILLNDLRATLNPNDITNMETCSDFFIFTRSLKLREVSARTVQAGCDGEYRVIFSTLETMSDGTENDAQVSDGLDGPLMEILSPRGITGREKREQALIETYVKLVNQERAEKEALQKEIEMKNEFISFITHEFKTPLAVINSAVQAIEYLCKDELSNQFKGFLRKIKQNSFRQLRLVNNLLDITRINAGHYRVVKRNLDIIYLAREITESVRLYAQQKNISLEFLPSMPAKTVAMDEEKFERIMLNLLSNAIKFTPADRSVKVIISEKVNPSGSQISVKVQDEGVGIPKEKQQFIFERFGQVENSLTRESEGTGIGLSLVKRMVSVLGWSITVDSAPGKGSTFEVLLPDTLADEDQVRCFERFADSRLIQATEIEFSEIYQ